MNPQNNQQSSHRVFSDEESKIRRDWVESLVTAIYSQRGRDLSREKIEEYSTLWLPRCAHIPTESFDEFFALGQKCMAKTLDEWLAVWSIEQQGRQREFEREARRESFAREEAQAKRSDHPIRDAVFAKWRGESTPVENIPVGGVAHAG